MMPRALLAALAAGLALAGCTTAGLPRHTVTAPVAAGAGPVDARATPPTRALLASLKRIAPTATLFGHQDDLAYGVGWKNEPGRSDVRSTAGAYPAVYGWELGHLEHGAAENLDGVPFAQLPGWIREGYARGGAITISWHMDNPVTGKTAWDPTPAVAALLPGGARHALYRQWLDRFVAFDRRLTVNADGSGGLIPVIFRPFHENTGSWFWWGGKNVSPADYIALWRFTVDYLRKAGLHNLLFAYSTDVADSEAEYLRNYPGDAYVDVLGMDDYQALKADATIGDMTRRLKMLVRLADARGKLPALTETGLGGQAVPNWWTGRLLEAINGDPDSRRIAWVLVWRNATAKQHYVPMPDGPAAADFRAFAADPTIRLGDRVPPLYGAR